jgi:hypothetical protein
MGSIEKECCDVQGKVKVKGNLLLAQAAETVFSKKGNHFLLNFSTPMLPALPALTYPINFHMSDHHSHCQRYQTCNDINE